MLVDQILPHAGPAYEPYAQATFDRCMRILAMQLAASSGAGMSNGQHPPIEPEKEFVICSLDLVSGLAESLGPAMEAYVGRSNLRAILIQCCGVSTLKCFLSFCTSPLAEDRGLTGSYSCIFMSGWKRTAFAVEGAHSSGTHSNWSGDCMAVYSLLLSGIPSCNQTRSRCNNADDTLASYLDWRFRPLPCIIYGKLEAWHQQQNIGVAELQLTPRL